MILGGREPFLFLCLEISVLCIGPEGCNEHTTLMMPWLLLLRPVSMYVRRRMEVEHRWLEDMATSMPTSRKQELLQ